MTLLTRREAAGLCRMVSLRLYLIETIGLFKETALIACQTRLLSI